MGAAELMTSVTFTYQSGLLLRGGVKRQLKAYCWQHGLDCVIEEAKPFYRATITGPAPIVQSVYRDIVHWFST